MSDAFIIGWGHTPFGKFDQLDLEQLIRDAVQPALEEARNHSDAVLVVENDRISEYRTTVNIAFSVER